VQDCHKAKLEAWIAGFNQGNSNREVMGHGVDVICVRSAACGKAIDRGGTVNAELVSHLVPEYRRT